MKLTPLTWTGRQDGAADMASGNCQEGDRKGVGHRCGIGTGPENVEEDATRDGDADCRTHFVGRVQHPSGQPGAIRFDPFDDHPNHRRDRYAGAETKCQWRGTVNGNGGIVWAYWRPRVSRHLRVNAGCAKAGSGMGTREIQASPHLDRPPRSGYASTGFVGLPVTARDIGPIHRRA
jgi:hypothetical protein